MSGDGQRWHERVGVQINHPPPEEPEPDPGPADPAYVRPPLWRRSVAPFWLAFVAQMAVFVIAVVVFAAAGVDDGSVFLPAYLVSMLGFFAVETWWRRNHPPSADRPLRPLWRRLRRSRTG
jgi:hypothetical protein